MYTTRFFYFLKKNGEMIYLEGFFEPSLYFVLIKTKKKSVLS